jgi:multimeric flavodoxin WrbA
MKKVLTLYSSARPDGNTYQLVNTFNQLLPNELCYIENLSIAQYDYQFRHQDDDFVCVIDKMLNADVIILASPVYWYSLTPTFRKLFDRFTDLTELPHLKPKGKRLREKVFYLFATSVHAELPASFVLPVENTLNYFGWKFAGTIHVNCRGAFNRAEALPLLRKLADVLSAIS